MEPRQPLLDALSRYLTQAASEHERAMAQVTFDFVREEPRCAERSLEGGHLTASGWVVDHAGLEVLLTHHRKLQMWLQLGGHADGDLNLARVAEKEVLEESGLKRVRLATPEIFDVDRHWIPAHKAVAAHWHYDVRYLFIADRSEPFVVSEESHALAWVKLSELHLKTQEESMKRMASKTAHA